MTDGDTRVRELTDDEKAQLRLDLEILKRTCDEYGFLIRLPIREGYQGAVEPLLYGGGRLHIFTDAELGGVSDISYDFERAIEAIGELGELTLDPDREIQGWRRRQTLAGIEYPGAD